MRRKLKSVRKTVKRAAGGLRKVSRKTLQSDASHQTYRTNTVKYTISSIIYRISQNISDERQGCGLGLDVSVLRRSRDAPTSRLDKKHNVSVRV